MNPTAAPLHVLTDGARTAPQTSCVHIQELTHEGFANFIWRRLWRSPAVTLHSSETPTRPFRLMLCCRLMSTGPVTWRRPNLVDRTIHWRDVLSAGGAFLRDALARPFVMASLRKRADMGQDTAAPLKTDAEDGAALVIAPSLTMQEPVGGMVTHLRGVLAGLTAHNVRPTFYTTIRQFPVPQGCLSHVLRMPERYHDIPELPWLVMSDSVIAQIERETGPGKPQLVYERNTIYSRAGRTLANRWNVPFVLEFNGSEPWMAQHWGGGLRHAALGDAFERQNLASADLVVTVSDELRAQAIERGARENAIIVVPNGVDLDCFNPDVDGARVRERLGSGTRIIIGFSGTFGPWHGAELLAEAYRALVLEEPEVAEKTCLVMFGDGPGLATVKDILATLPPEYYRLTGMIAVQEIAPHLAACDVLASPQIVDPDSGVFFGSPTKLFEYMAMARAIVAADAGQIADVITDDQNGLLFKAGSACELRLALKKALLDPALRERLGRQARIDAEARHGWDRHVGAILAKLRGNSP
jgi:glycosyltransferase involved in cell wall biosynthesis